MSVLVASLVSVVFASGVALVAGAMRRARRPRLGARLDPYLRGLGPGRSALLEAAEVPLTPFPLLERLLRPLLQEGARLVDRWVGGSGSVVRRLREAGRPDELARFRAEQALWALVGFAAGAVGALGLPPLLGRGAAPSSVVGASAAGVLGGVLGRDWWLSREVRRRQGRMLAEFPALADLVCLAVTAGEGPRAAIERAVACSRGEMSRELGLVLADLRVGVGFAAAMGRLAARVPLPQVVRFVDGLVVAVERGTPLAEVLRAQAADVREQHKRSLMEAGARREALMLVPVVFLSLPVVVLFALYPGLVSLSVFAR